MHLASRCPMTAADGPRKPKMAQDRPHMDQYGPKKAAKKGPQNESKGLLRGHSQNIASALAILFPQGALRWSKKAQGSPGWPSMGPSWPIKKPPKGAKWPQDGFSRCYKYRKIHGELHFASRWFQDALRWSKMAPDIPRWSRIGSRWANHGLQKGRKKRSPKWPNGSLRRHS